MELTIVDESIGSEEKREFTLRDLAETLTVKEVIQARIYQEVRDYNMAGNLSRPFEGLVVPAKLEKALNAKGVSPRREINWEVQVERACEAFDRNGFVVLIDDEQAESLDHAFRIEVDTKVSFIKLVPLVGG